MNVQANGGYRILDMSGATAFPSDHENVQAISGLYNRVKVVLADDDKPVILHNLLVNAGGDSILIGDTFIDRFNVHISSETITFAVGVGVYFVVITISALDVLSAQFGDYGSGSSELQLIDISSVTYEELGALDLDQPVFIKGYTGNPISGEVWYQNYTQKYGIAFVEGDTVRVFDVDNTDTVTDKASITLTGVYSTDYASLAQCAATIGSANTYAYVHGKYYDAQYQQQDFSGTNLPVEAIINSVHSNHALLEIPMSITDTDKLITAQTVMVHIPITKQGSTYYAETATVTIDGITYAVWFNYPKFTSATTSFGLGVSRLDHNS